MKKTYCLESLDTNVTRHFDRNVSRSLIRALVSALVIATVLASLFFLFSGSLLGTICAFGIAAFLSLNVTFLKMVPSKAARKKSHMLIMAAAKDPERIDDSRPGIYAVQTDDGGVHDLNTIEQQVWRELVVPFLCKMHSRVLADQKRVAGHVLTKSEMRQLREQRETVKEDEARLKEDRLKLAAKRQDMATQQKRLAAEEKSLQRSRQEIEIQASSLQEAEDLMISRLSEIEVAEAQMAQLREDLDRKQQAGQSTEMNSDHLKRKEAEVEALRLSLEEDKHLVEMQKTELNQLKGELIRAGDTEEHTNLTPEGSLRLREQELEAQLSSLKEANRELEARSQYVQNVEDSLIDRLNAMSEREAFIEQGEVDAGLRADV